MALRVRAAQIGTWVGGWTHVVQLPEQVAPGALERRGAAVRIRSVGPSRHTEPAAVHDHAQRLAVRQLREVSDSAVVLLRARIEVRVHGACESRFGAEFRPLSSWRG